MNIDRITLLALISLGGGFGAAARYFLSSKFDFKNGKPRTLPYGTLAVNLLACFALGLLCSESMREVLGRGNLFFALTFGVCASASTFSSFAFQIAELLRKRKFAKAFFYAFASYSGGFVLTSVGMYAF